MRLQRPTIHTLFRLGCVPNVDIVDCNAAPKTTIPSHKRESSLSLETGRVQARSRNTQQHRQTRDMSPRSDPIRSEPFFVEVFFQHLYSGGERCYREGGVLDFLGVRTPQVMGGRVVITTTRRNPAPLFWSGMWLSKGPFLCLYRPPFLFPRLQYFF